MERFGVLGRLLLPIIVVGGVLAIGTAWYTNRATDRLATEAVLASARKVSDQMRKMRGYYTKHVVGPAIASGMSATFDHADQPGTIPLPATFVHELAGLMNEAYSGNGFEVRLYSDYPFPFRRDGGARDEFEAAALRRLREAPEEEYYQRADRDGHQVVRFATADLMVNETCVGCHNSHPDSPKTDWKLGDVRGVLEVIMPLDDGGFQALTAGGRNLVFVFVVGIGRVIRIAITTTTKLMKREPNGLLIHSKRGCTRRSITPSQRAASPIAFSAKARLMERRSAHCGSQGR